MINRVSELFKGNTALILGFNTFLPPGYKIEIDEETQEPITSTPSSAQQQQPTVQVTSSQQAHQPKAEEQKEEKTKEAAAPKKTNPAATATVTTTPSSAPSTGKQSIDFDQAINYVSKIKARFQDQPDTYKAFLDILHTYQKDQTTIKKVFEQVSILFKDHPVCTIFVILTFLEGSP